MAEEYEAVEIQKSDEVRDILEYRHVLDDEIKMVIHSAECSRKKLHQPKSDRYLAKLRIANATFYAEYSVSGKNSYIVHTAYAHRTKLEQE